MPDNNAEANIRRHMHTDPHTHVATVSDLLKEMANELRDDTSPSARLDAELLLGHVLRKNRTELFTPWRCQGGPGTIRRVRQSCASTAGRPPRCAIGRRTGILVDETGRYAGNARTAPRNRNSRRLRAHTICPRIRLPTYWTSAPAAERSHSQSPRNGRMSR